MPAPIKWKPDFELVNLENPEGEPWLSASPDGRFSLVFFETLAGPPVHTDLEERIYTAAGVEQSAIGTTFSATTNEHQAASAYLPDGRRVHVWTEEPVAGGGNLEDVYAEIRFGNNIIDVARFLVTGGAGRQHDPVVAANSSGFVVAMADDSVAGGQLILKFYNIAGTPINTVLAPNAPQTVSTQSADQYRDVEIVALANGNYVVVWDSQFNADVFARVYSSGGVAQSGVIDVQTGAPGAAFPDVTALADGRFAVTYAEYIVGNVRGRIFNSDGTPDGVSFAIGSGLANDTDNQVQTAALHDGRFVTVWKSTAGEIRGQVMFADGTPDGAAFTVNTVTAGDQSRPTIATLADGRFAVSWESGAGATPETIITTIFDPRETGLVTAASSLDDDWFGTSFADQIFGGAGRDTLRGAGDIDELRGDAGNDTLFGDDGADRLFGGNNEDLLNGGAGADSWLGGDLGNDTVNGGAGNDRIDGGDGGDTLNGEADADSITGGNGNDTINGGDGNDSLLDGGAGNDTIDGGLGNDSLTGGAGNDTLIGAIGADTLLGGTENDSLDGGASNDSVDGGAGDDTVAGSAGSDTLAGGFGVDTVLYDIFGGAITVNLTLTTDQITGAGTDRLSGFEHIVGGIGADNFIGSGAANSMVGGGGNDTLSGVNGADTLIGGTGNDNLLGGAGTDTLRGGAGLDTLTGGTDADVFDYDAAGESTAGALRDRIVDFVQGSDTIDLVGIDAIDGGADDAFTFIGGAAFSAAGQLRAFQLGGLTIIEGSTDADNAAEFQIALTGLFTLVAGDFVL